MWVYTSSAAPERRLDTSEPKTVPIGSASSLVAPQQGKTPLTAGNTSDWSHGETGFVENNGTMIATPCRWRAIADLLTVSAVVRSCQSARCRQHRTLAPKPYTCPATNRAELKFKTIPSLLQMFKVHDPIVRTHSTGTTIGPVLATFAIRQGFSCSC